MGKDLTSNFFSLANHVLWRTNTPSWSSHENLWTPWEHHDFEEICCRSFWPVDHWIRKLFLRWCEAVKIPSLGFRRCDGWVKMGIGWTCQNPMRWGWGEHVRTHGYEFMTDGWGWGWGAHVKRSGWGTHVRIPWSYVEEAPEYHRHNSNIQNWFCWKRQPTGGLIKWNVTGRGLSVIGSVANQR